VLQAVDEDEAATALEKVVYCILFRAIVKTYVKNLHFLLIYKVYILVS
jgi:hypothetical protein